MRFLELFSGTGVMSQTFNQKGHSTFSVDFNPEFNPDLCIDILELTVEMILEKFGQPDVIWASPDCTSYSIAAASYHRATDGKGNVIPMSNYAIYCDEVNVHVLDLIHRLSPTFYFIENPRGGLRKMKFMQDYPRYTVTYCQYGDTRMKPTDIWTNHPEPQFKPMCKNGDSCHEAAPRGSKTGTQGIDGSKERSRIPQGLCDHICNICEEYIR